MHFLNMTTMLSWRPASFSGLCARACCKTVRASQTSLHKLDWPLLKPRGKHESVILFSKYFTYAIWWQHLWERVIHVHASNVLCEINPYMISKNTLNRIPNQNAPFEEYWRNQKLKNTIMYYNCRSVSGALWWRMATTALIAEMGYYRI